MEPAHCNRGGCKAAPPPYQQLHDLQVLKGQQGLPRTLFLRDCRNADELLPCFPTQSFNSWNDQKGDFPIDAVCPAHCPWIGGAFDATPPGVPSI